MSEYYTDNGKLEMLVYWIGFAEPSREEWRPLDNNNFVYNPLIMHEGEQLPRRRGLCTGSLKHPDGARDRQRDEGP